MTLIRDSMNSGSRTHGRVGHRPRGGPTNVIQLDRHGIILTPNDLSFICEYRERHKVKGYWCHLRSVFQEYPGKRTYPLQKTSLLLFPFQAQGQRLTWSKACPSCSSRASFCSDKTWFLFRRACPIRAASSRSRSLCKATNTPFLWVLKKKKHTAA